MEIPRSTISFLIWMCKKTSSVQSNVRWYKDKYYFIDTETVSDKDGGIKELYAEFIKDTLG